jgi:hypothetical protein
MIDNLASTITNISDDDSAIVLLGSLPKSHEGLVVSISGQFNLTLEGVPRRKNPKGEILRINLKPYTLSKNYLREISKEET